MTHLTVIASRALKPIHMSSASQKFGEAHDKCGRRGVRGRGDLYSWTHVRIHSVIAPRMKTTLLRHIESGYRDRHETLAEVWRLLSIVIEKEKEKEKVGGCRVKSVSRDEQLLSPCHEVKASPSHA